MDVSPTIQHLHGRLVSITGTDPAAGAEISETVPARRRWLLHAFHFQLITDATVANRLVALTIDDGTNEFWRHVVTAVQAASLNWIYTFSNYGAPEILSGVSLHIPLPPLLLYSSYRIRTSTYLIEGGDNFIAPQLLVEEWIDP